MKKYYIIILSVLILSCEDIITPDLPSNEPILVVDAWINNLEKDQVIKLSESQNYLDSSTPIPVVGASVFVYDENQNQFTFTEVDDGEYIWTPDSVTKNIGEVGTNFYLILLVTLLFVTSNYLLMPLINKYRDEKQDKKFKYSHFVSVVINFALNIQPCLH